LIYNPRLAKVKVDLHSKNQGQRSNGSNRRAPTDGHTNKFGRRGISVYIHDLSSLA